MGDKSSGTDSTTNRSIEKQYIQKSDSGNLEVGQRPHKNHSPSDIVIDLNENVYIQIQFIQVLREHEVKQRRAFFLVPDPDLSDEIGEETSATWVELLGDVFYVGWIT